MLALFKKGLVAIKTFATPVKASRNFGNTSHRSGSRKKSKKKNFTKTPRKSGQSLSKFLFFHL